MQITLDSIFTSKSCGMTARRAQLQSTIVAPHMEIVEAHIGVLEGPVGSFLLFLLSESTPALVLC